MSTTVILAGTYAKARRWFPYAPLDLRDDRGRIWHYTQDGTYHDGHGHSLSPTELVESSDLLVIRDDPRNIEHRKRAARCLQRTVTQHAKRLARNGRRPIRR